MEKSKANSYHCRLWIGHHSPDGYGVLEYKGKPYLAHRIMWQAFHGPIPQGKLILHKCDTPACFNPHHLFLGTYLDNNRDRMNKGRSAVGEKSGRHKLTTSDVLAIRKQYENGQTQVALGKAYGVSSHTVSMIVRRHIWRSV